MDNNGYTGSDIKATKTTVYQCRELSGMMVYFINNFFVLVKYFIIIATMYA